MTMPAAMDASRGTGQALSDPADALQRISEVLRLSRSAIWEIDRDGIFTYVSPSFEDLMGYRPEEVIGLKTIHDFYPPDLPADLRAEVYSDWVGRSEEFIDFEVPLLTKAGRMIWVASHGKPVFDDSGRLTGFRGADTDITARKQAESGVVSREQRLLELIASAPVAIAHTDLKHAGEMVINRRFEELFGYSAKEIPTMDAWFVRAYPDEDYRREVMQRSDEWIAAVGAGRSKLEPQDYRITCKDGRVLDIEIGAALVGDRFLGTFVDVTARKRSLEQLQAAETHLRRVLEHVPFPVAMAAAWVDFDWTDPRARVTFFNRRLTELLGYDSADVPLVSDWARACFPDNEYRLRVMAEIDAQVRRAVVGESEVGPFEVRVTAKDGRVLDTVLKAVAVGSQLIIALEDQTERNRAERILADQREQLARVGRVSALGQLAASLAHELDQPLGAILNNAEAADILLSRENAPNPELRAIVKDIIEDDRRAGEVLDRIRAMVQKQPFQSACLAVPDLLREMGPLIKAAIGSKPIGIELSCEPGLRPVEGDRVLLQQALLNLVLNSVDAIGSRPNGAIGITAGEDQTDTVCIRVRDNGGGVPEGEHIRLLEPFHTTKEGGLGMGLAIVNSIAEQHGGRLRIENQPGRGLAVSLLLPVWRGMA